MVVGGSLAKPEIVADEMIEILGDSGRFCFHMAAEMNSCAPVRPHSTGTTGRLGAR